MANFVYRNKAGTHYGLSARDETEAQTMLNDMRTEDPDFGYNYVGQVGKNNVKTAAQMNQPKKSATPKNPKMPGTDFGADFGEGSETGGTMDWGGLGTGDTAETTSTQAADAANEGAGAIGDDPPDKDEFGLGGPSDPNAEGGGLPTIYDAPTGDPMYGENPARDRFLDELALEELRRNTWYQEESLARQYQNYELDREIAGFNQEMATLDRASANAADRNDMEQFREIQAQQLDMENARNDLQIQLQKNELDQRTAQQVAQHNLEVSLEQERLSREAIIYGASRQDLAEDRKLAAEARSVEIEIEERLTQVEESRINGINTYNSRQNELQEIALQHDIDSAAARDETERYIAYGNWQNALDMQDRQYNLETLNRQNQKQMQQLDLAFQREQLDLAQERQTIEIEGMNARVKLDRDQFNQSIRQFNRQQGLQELQFAAELSRDPGSFMQAANLQRGLPLDTAPAGLTSIAGAGAPAAETGTTAGAATGGAPLPPALEALRAGETENLPNLRMPDVGLGTPSVQQLNQLAPTEQQALIGLVESLGINQDDFIRFIQATAPSQQTNVLTAA